jgi:undecaprenyl-diphosphatase
MEFPSLRVLATRPEVRLLAGWVALAAVVWAFLALAGEFREGELDAMDLRILSALRVPGQPHVPIGPHWLIGAMRDITALGGVIVIALITAASAAVLAMHGRTRAAVVLAIAVTAAQLSNDLFKLLFGRMRPPTFVVYGDLPASLSFPSGHSTVATATYFLLALIVARLEARPAAKILLFVIAAMLAIAVGVSRVYLGVHWPSDVLAGWCAGGAWALLAGLAWTEFDRRSGAR